MLGALKKTLNPPHRVGEGAGGTNGECHVAWAQTSLKILGCCSEREREKDRERERESAAFFGRSANCARRRLGMLLPQREDDATRSIMSHESHAPTLAASKEGERGGGSGTHRRRKKSMKAQLNPKAIHLLLPLLLLLPLPQIAGKLRCQHVGAAACRVYYVCC